jgi:septation ring formation regulator EzrA
VDKAHFYEDQLQKLKEDLDELIKQEHYLKTDPDSSAKDYHKYLEELIENNQTITPKNCSRSPSPATEEQIPQYESLNQHGIMRATDIAEGTTPNKDAKE